MNSQPTFLFLTYLGLMNYGHVNQVILNCKILESLALQIFEASIRILLIVNLIMNQTLLIFLLCVRLTWMTQFWQFLSDRLSSFNPKGF